MGQNKLWMFTVASNKGSDKENNLEGDIWEVLGWKYELYLEVLFDV